MEVSCGGGRNVTFARDEHVKTVRECLWTLFKERRMVDVNVFCHGHQFQAHKVVLAVSSPVLKTYFTSWRNNPISAIQISDRGIHLDYVAEHASDVAHLVEFAYTGKVKVPRDRVKPLLRLAETLLVKTLIDTIVAGRDGPHWERSVNAAGCVTLSCNDHPRLLGDGLWQLLQENYVVDTNVVCRELMVRAHKVVLSAASPVLSSFLTGTSNWPQCGVVVTILGLHLDYIAEENTDTMSLLEFLYRGRVTIPESRVRTVLNLATKLEVRRLVDEILAKQSKAHQKVESLGGRAVPHSQEQQQQQQQPLGIRSEVVEGAACRSLCLEAEKRAAAAAAAANQLVAPNTSTVYPFAVSQAGGGGSSSSSSAANWSIPSASGKASDIMGTLSSIMASGGGQTDVSHGYNKGTDVNGTSAQQSWAAAAPVSTSSSQQQQAYLRHPDMPTQKWNEWRKNEGFEGGLQFQNGPGATAATQAPAATATATATVAASSSSSLPAQAIMQPALGASPSIRKEYVCGICKEILQDNDSYERHMSTHRNPNQCPLCPFYSPQKGRLTQHLAAIHRIDERGNQLPDASRCTLCDYSCSAPHKLTQHYMKKHCKDKPYRCSLCDYATVIEQELEKHVRQRHPDRKRHECAICGFLARTKTGLTLHARSHDRGKVHKCHVCKEAFATKDKLEVHMLRHCAVSSYSCQVCGIACPTVEGLHLHLSRAHGFQPPLLQNDVGAGASGDIVRIVNNEQITELRVL